MVGTILPVVYGEVHGKNQKLILGLHILGYICGGIILGMFLGLLGSILFGGAVSSKHGALVMLGTACLSLLYGLQELELVRLPNPQCRRQVPRNWRRLGVETMSFLYGAALGIGVATRIPVGTFYVVTAWAILSKSFFLGALCMVSFGLGRGLPLIWLTYRFRTASECSEASRKLAGWKCLVHVFNGLALGFAGSCLLAAGFTLYSQ